jgi:hypothetical protein
MATHKKPDPLLPVGPDGTLTPQHIVLVRRLALLGLDEKRIAETFGVSHRTLGNWKLRSPEFVADAEVVEGLFQLTRNRVVEKAKPVAVEGGVEVVRWSESAEPDFRAVSHWLACRRPEQWALNKAKAEAEIDASESTAGERAVAALLEECRKGGGEVREVLGIAALLGIGHDGER